MNIESITSPWLGARLRRFFLACVALASLAACGTRVDGLDVSWKHDGVWPVLVASDQAACPDMSGAYLSQGRVLASSLKSSDPANLHRLLMGPMAMSATEGTAQGAWESAATATVTWRTLGDDGWSIVSDDSQGHTLEGRMRKLNGVTDTEGQPKDFSNTRHGPLRTNGCTDGRLWVATTNTWTQYESISTVRYVAVLRPELGGLRVSLLSERRSLGLLPWWSSDTDTAQYWFDRAPTIP